MAQPLLHLGDVGLVVQRVGRRRRPQRVRADLEAQRRRVAPHDLVDRVRRQGLRPATAPVVMQRPEQRPGVITPVARRLQVLRHTPARGRVQRHVPRLAAFARHRQVHHAAPLLARVLHPQPAQLVMPQRVVQQHRQRRPVALASERPRLRRIQQLARLIVPDRRGLVLVALHGRPPHTLHRVVRHRVALAQVLGERRHCGQPVADRLAADGALRQILAPRDHVGTG
ncbi:MAG: hypothetical protein MUE97_05350, partial [Phycisphaerales bacterium]|nr:hypothetical protein [Phycisphaerales bacterium]